MVTTDSETGEVVSEVYVGSSCTGSGGDNDNSNSNGSNNGIGPYLCPSSFKSTYLANDRWRLATYGVKARYNDITVEFSIAATLPKRIPYSFATELQLLGFHGDIYLTGGVTINAIEGYIEFDEKALRVIAARATDYGATVVPESLLLTGQVDYLDVLSSSAKQYLAEFGFGNNTNSQYWTLPGRVELAKPAQQVDWIFKYWFSECSN